MNWLGHDAAWLVGEMDQLGIDVTWLLTWLLIPDEDDAGYHVGTNAVHARADGTHAAMPLDDILEARGRWPDRFIAGYCPPPIRSNAPELFEAAYQIHGVRVCGEFSYRIPLDDPRCIELFRTAGRLQCPVVLHMDVARLAGDDGRPQYQSRWYGGSVENLQRALIACGDTVFIGHGPGFWRAISGDANSDPAVYPNGPITPGGRLYALLDEHANLWADLSAGSGMNALQRGGDDHAVRFIERYGDRLLFGRDRYGDDLLGYLESLPLDGSLRQKVYHENARRLVL